jgi:serine/threonine-protein kinase
MLARRQLRPLLGAATAGLTVAVVLWACSGEVLPPPGESGFQAPPGSGPASPDGGAPDGGPGGTDGGGGTDAGSATDRFPAGATIYQDVSSAPLDPSSTQIIAHLADAGWGTGAMQIDFSFDVLHTDSSVQPRAFIPAAGYYSPDCDQIPVPVPAGGAAEGSSSYACDTSRNDCHLLVYQGRRLYELYQANIAGGLSTGSPFTTVCAVVWDLDHDYWSGDTPYSRGDQCTSADAAGLPIAPLLVSGAELQAGVVPHALRFILPTRAWPRGCSSTPRRMPARREATRCTRPTARASGSGATSTSRACRTRRRGPWRWRSRGTG